MRNTTKTLISVAAAATLVAALAACGGTEAANPSANPSGSGGGDAAATTWTGTGNVTFANFGGSGSDAQRAAWFDPFEEATGVEVITDDPVSFTRIMEMVDAQAVVWDIAQGNISRGAVDNPYLDFIDCDIVDCAAFDDAAFPAYPQAVPLYTLASVLTYNTDTFQEGDLTGLRDFFDPSIEGLRDIRTFESNGWAGFIEAALITDGVPRDELYPLDVDRALKVFERVKDDIVLFQDGDQCVNDVISGEAIMGICENGRAGLFAVDGYPVGVAWALQAQECDYIYIPKGAPNIESAQHLIAYIVDNEGAIGNHVAYGAANPKARGLDATSKWIDFLPTEHELTGDDSPIFVDLAWWGENRPQVIEKISEWMAG
ncbi:MAG: extracellular solute-binding protein [Bifidobacteriaceae bacterium]|jgi:putative spermidine/putrescine transport system substrate-binding protein|nr:extracellular solute-binding protein [Bifidobacteriaceae bacterium]